MVERDRVARLRELAEQAQASADQASVAATLADIQRITALALSEAVTRERARGTSWRELAAELRMAVTTLHGQYRSGLDEFVGREEELADLRPRLSRSRLVTLVGPVGVGKTRLAAEFADRARGANRSRVWWVDLAPLPPGSLIAATVAAAMGVRDAPRRDLVDALADACGGRSGLLVLDNCEHVLDGCAELLPALLGGCRQLRVLATSREALRVPGEALYPVEPLPVPADGAGVREMRRSAAVRLFVDRARLVLPSFDLSDELLRTVAAVCVQLDGLPLAIELAAGQVAVLPPAQLLHRLGSRLTLLATAARTASARHRSLRAAIEWSYDLLTAEEQEVFRRLAMFPGGFDEPGAVALCADLELTGDELWRRVTGLATKSVLAPDRVHGSGRFRILQSLRVFGVERLHAAGELAGAQQRLMAWAMELARLLAREPTLPGPLRRRVLDERHNLRLAVQIAREADDERYPWLVTAFASACMAGGELGEAITVLEDLVHRAGPDAPVVRAAALVELAWVWRVRGDYETARRCGEEALALAHQADEPTLAARARNELVPTYRCLGDAERAIAMKHQEVDHVRANGTRQELAMTLAELGWDLLATDHLTQAAAAVDEAMFLLREEDEILRWGPIRHSAGSVALLAGDLDQAVVHFTVALANEPANVEDVPYNLEGLALVAGRRGAAERTLRLLAAASAARAAEGVAAEPWWSELCEDAGTVARHQLSKVRAAAATAEGAVLSAEEASVYAILDKLPEAVSRTRGNGLTRREYEVARLVAEGLTTPQIAARLAISGRTVASHVASIRTKLDLPTRGHITAWVARRVTDREPGADAT